MVRDKRLGRWPGHVVEGDRRSVRGQRGGACHVVVLLARLSWHEALHQQEPAKGEEAYPADHEHAIYYGEYQRGSPLVSLTNRYSSCYYRCATNFLELRTCELL